MRYLWILMLCAAPVAAQNVDKTVEVQVQDAPKNPTTLLQTDQGRGARIGGAKLSPNGKLVALYGSDSGDPNLAKRQRKGTVQIWNVNARQRVFDLVGHSEGVANVCWSRDGKWLASESQDGEIRLWNAATGKLAHLLAPKLDTPSSAQLNSDAKITREAEWAQWANLITRPRLLGFAPDGLQVLAIGGKADLPNWKAARAAEKSEKKTVSMTDFITPLLSAWEVKTGQNVRNVPFGKMGALQMHSALNEDGRSFTVLRYAIKGGVEDGQRIETRDVVSGALQNSFATVGDFSYLVALSEDGKRVVALAKKGDDLVLNRAQIWDVATQKPLQVLADNNANFARTHFAEGNKTLLVGGKTGDILVFDAQSGALKRRLGGGHWGDIGTLDLTPDEHTLISVGDQDSAVQLWDLTVAAGAKLQSRALVRDANVRQIAPAPDGSFWIGYGNADWRTEPHRGESVELRHLSGEGDEIEIISLPEKFLVDNVTFSSDFKMAAGTLGTQPQPGFLQGAGIGVWDLEHKKLLWHLPGNRYLNDTLIFAPDGTTLVSGRNDGVVQLWDLTSGELVRQLFKTPDENRISALTFTRDGKTLAIGNDGGTIQMLDVASGNVRDELTEDFVPNAITFSPDGKYVMSGGNIEIGGTPVGFKVTLRAAQTKTLLREWTHDQGVAENRAELLNADKADGGRYFGGLAFSPDSQLLAFSHFNNLMRTDLAQVEIWDIASNARVGVIPDRASLQAPSFASDGKSVFTTDGSWIKSWNLAEVLAQNAKP